MVLHYHSLMVGIVWESPAIITVDSWARAIAIYCLPSVHPNCVYNWRMIGNKSPIFPSTPVIYINKAGMYQCEVEYQTKKKLGKLITVCLEIGTVYVIIVDRYYSSLADQDSGCHRRNVSHRSVSHRSDSGRCRTQCFS